MSKGSRSKSRKPAPGRKPAPKGRGRRPAPRGARRGVLPRWAPWAALAVVAVVIAGAVILKNRVAATPSGRADPTVVADVTGVPATTLDTVGVPAGVTAPTALPSGTPSIEADGKPLVLYVGAEYCPFCAAERWPVVVALSRFGTFSNLGQTESAGVPEAYPRTPTLSFHGASYTSPLVAFQGVETATNQLGLSGYGPLDALTPEQQQLFATYDVPPYVSSAHAIPFVLIGNRYVFNGSQFIPTVLRGLTAQQIAASLKDPASEVAKAVDGSANLLTAAICNVTGGRPADVCTSPAVTAAAAKLPT